MYHKFLYKAKCILTEESPHSILKILAIHNHNQSDEIINKKIQINYI